MEKYIYLPLLLLKVYIAAYIPNFDEASYFGNSFFTAPFRNESKTSDLRIQFMATPSCSGILFMAANEVFNQDYLLLTISSGKIEIMFNLGSGTTHAIIDEGVRYDDGRMHSLYLKRNKRNLTLIVGGSYKKEIVAVGEFDALNIDRIFLGGVPPGDPLKHISIAQPKGSYFRGCIRLPIFNGKNLYNLQKDVNQHKMLWGCSDTFLPQNFESLSFDGKLSFALFYKIPVTYSLLFEIKTRSSDAIILFGESAKKSNFFHFILLKGILKAQFHLEEEQTDIFSPIRINDGTWHRVLLVFSRSSIILKIDDNKEIAEFISLSNSFDFSSALLFGGLADSSILNVTSRVGRVAPMEGCIRRVYADGKLIGLLDIGVSENLKKHCEWEYKCALQPCISNTRCVEREKGKDFHCQCEENGEDACLKSNWQQAQINITKPVAELSPLFVEEGGYNWLTRQNVNLTNALTGYSLEYSEITLRLLPSMKYGSIRMKGKILKNYDTFSYQDILDRSLSYYHSGNEEVSDTILIRLELSPSLTFRISEHIQVGEELVIPVLVKPVNDKPLIQLPKGIRIPLTKKDNLLIDPQYLQCRDPDTLDRHLRWSIEEGSMAPKIFNVNGIVASYFTQKEVNDRIVRLNSIDYLKQPLRLKMRCMDSELAYELAEIEMYAVNLTLTVIRNTGIWLRPTTEVVISPFNLSIESSHSKDDVHYSIIEGPRYGRFQKFNLVLMRWDFVSSFTQHDININSVKYMGNYLQPPYPGPFNDLVRFNVSTQASYFLPVHVMINFLRVDISVVRNRRLVISGESNALQCIDRRKLLTITNLYDPPANITYIIKKVPKHGNIFLNYPNSKNKFLGLNFRFTQEDINANRLYYHFRRVSDTELKDQFLFQIYVIGALSSQKDYNILYRPRKYEDFDLINYGLKGLNEGSSSFITTDHLRINSSQRLTCNFHVLKEPGHGKLLFTSKSRSRQNVKLFTNDDLTNDRLQYVHDDSEWTDDYFQFKIICQPVAMNGRVNQTRFQLTDNFDIEINLVNDNPPIRIRDHVVNVDLNRSIIVRAHNILFADKDTNFKSEHLQYNFEGTRGSRLGYFISTKSGEPLYQFKQSDIINNSVSYLHRGDPLARVPLSVTDGKFVTATVLTVNVTSPYFHIDRYKSILVSRNSSVIVFFPIILNVIVKPESIRITIAESPKAGRLILKNQSELPKTISYADILAYSLIYMTTDDASQMDSFKLFLSGSHLDIHTNVTFDVTIWSHVSCSSNIDRNRLIVGLPLATIPIDNSVLFRQNSATELIYNVIKTARWGTLKLQHSTFVLSNVTLFRQADLIHGRIYYKHFGPNLSQDSFTVQAVSCDKKTMSPPITMHIYLRKPNFIITHKNLTVVFKSTVPLNSVKFSMSKKSNYVKKLNTVSFQLVDKPKYGSIYSTRLDRSTDNFNYGDIRSGAIVYKHTDYSQQFRDNFTMIAEDSESGARCKSLLYIEVILKQFVESLYLKINKRGSIWADSSAILTSNQLTAISDNVPSTASIIFTVVTSRYGYFEKREGEKRSQRVKKFSQEDINNRVISFVHNSPTEDSVIIFLFSITDGIHITSNLHTFEFQVRYLKTNLVHLRPLLVFPPLLMQRLTEHELLVTTNDLSKQAIINFKLLRTPRFGRLVKVSGASHKPVLTPIEHFTMDQITAAIIAYQPFTSAVKKFTDVSDVFYDTADVQILTKPSSMMKDFVLNISLSYRNVHSNNQQDLLRIAPIHVREGGKSVINDRILQVDKLKQIMNSTGFHYATILFILASRPGHGDLKISHEVLDIGRVISLKELKDGLLYLHDDSDNVEDKFDLQIAFSPSSTLRPDVFNITLSISIEPINDQMFALIINKQITIVETSSVVINSSYLLVEDPDTSPADIVYLIRSPPRLGDMYLMRDFGSNIITREMCGRYCSFSQADIDAGKLLYQNRMFGHSETIRFNVSDKRHAPHNYNLSIVVEPYRMTLQLTTISLLQGDKYVPIKTDNIEIQSSSAEVDIQFNITLLPNYGIILRDATPVNDFTYRDVLAGRIRYNQLNLAYSADRIVFNVQAANENFYDHKLPIVIQPRITSSTLEINAGSSKPILTTHLSADQLYKEVGIVPNFTLLQTTTYGRLFVFPLQNNERNTHYNDVSEASGFWFTQEELRKGRLMYKAYSLSFTQQSSIIERINFTIRAGANCQPAIASVTVRILYEENLSNTIINGNPGSSSKDLFPVGDKERGFLSSNMMMLVVSVSCIIGIIILGVVTTAFLCWKRHQEERDVEINPDMTGSNYHEAHYPNYRDPHTINHSVSLLGNYPTFPQNGQTLPNRDLPRTKPGAALSRSVTYGSNYMAGIAAQNNKNMVTFSLSNQNIQSYDTAAPTKAAENENHLMLLATVSRGNRASQQYGNETVNRRPRTISGHSIVLEDQKLWV